MDPTPPPSIVERLRHGRWEVFAAYAAGGLAVLEAVDLFSERFGLPTWLFTAAVLLLILGVPLGQLLSRRFGATARATGPDAESAGDPGARAADHDAVEPVGGQARPASGRHRLSWRGAGTAFVGVLALWGVAAAGWLALTAGERRALELRATALAELPRLVEEGRFEEAYGMGREVEAVLPDDTVLARLRPRYAAEWELTSTPAGAVVYRRPYDGGDWERLGVTPLDIWLPMVTARLRYEADGYRPAEIVHFGILGVFPVPHVRLDPVDADVPADMVRVPGGEITVGSPGLEGLPPVPLADYHLDRYEVTNREFAEFVTAGGYRDSAYWTTPFRDGDSVLSFQQAMARFMDRTGRPGPATWEGGSFAPGSADLPVGGLSWYEAAAFARFAGADLPTLYHWYHAANSWLSPYLVARSNYDGDGPSAAGTYDGLARFGAYDMAGNVREWVWNEGRDGRYLLGGGWNDSPYTFVDPVTQPAFDRSPTNGLRLARFTDDTGLRAARAPIPTPTRDYASETPVDDGTFAIYRRMYDYDRAPLNTGVERTDTTDAWIRKRVTIDAAYGGERLPLHVFLPRHGEPPFQTVLFYPGSSGFRGGSSEPPRDTNVYDFIIRGGRAVIRPVFASTFERAGGRSHDQPDRSVSYRDHVIMWAKDMRRAIDYAEEHPDLDVDRLAYFGLSWGGRLGGLMVPLEPRFDAAVLYVAGLKFQPSLPEADPWNFLPRFETPVLMLNGRYDNFFPLETSQKPMFQAIASEEKRHIVVDGGHFVPRARLVRETLDWLDRYLGPVR